MREYVGEQLGDTVLSICQLVNRAQYMPNIPTREGLTDIYDDRFSDCEPYLFRIESNLSEFLYDILFIQMTAENS